ncbi:hypothetical protein GCM10027026_08470 [Myroides odoratimimus subsp. xuanwuensis]
MLSGLMALTLLGAVLSVPLVVGELRGSAASSRAVDLAEVVAVEDLDALHTSGDVDYEQTPPLGGEHAPVWWECGRYDEPVVDEMAVHSLEHGTVWITYDEGLSGADVDDLEAILPAEGILSPYPGLETPVVVSVWGRQLALTGADDPRLGLFIETFGDGGTAPEPFADCAGGVSDPDDAPDDGPPAGRPGIDSQTVGAFQS